MPSPYPWWPEQEIDQRIIRESLLPPGNTPSGLSAGSYKSQVISHSFCLWSEHRVTPNPIPDGKRQSSYERIPVPWPNTGSIIVFSEIPSNVEADQIFSSFIQETPVEELCSPLNEYDRVATAGLGFTTYEQPAFDVYAPSLSSLERVRSSVYWQTELPLVCRIPRLDHGLSSVEEIRATVRPPKVAARANPKGSWKVFREVGPEYDEPDVGPMMRLEGAKKRGKADREEEEEMWYDRAFKRKLIIASMPPLPSALEGMDPQFGRPAPTWPFGARSNEKWVPHTPSLWMYPTEEPVASMVGAEYQLPAMKEPETDRPVSLEEPTPMVVDDSQPEVGSVEALPPAPSSRALPLPEIPPRPVDDDEVSLGPSSASPSRDTSPAPAPSLTTEEIDVVMNDANGELEGTATISATESSRRPASPILDSRGRTASRYVRLRGLGYSVNLSEIRSWLANIRGEFESSAIVGLYRRVLENYQADYIVELSTTESAEQLVTAALGTRRISEGAVFLYEDEFRRETNGINRRGLTRTPSPERLDRISRLPSISRVRREPAPPERRREGSSPSPPRRARAPSGRQLERVRDIARLHRAVTESEREELRRRHSGAINLQGEPIQPPEDSGRKRAHSPSDEAGPSARPRTEIPREPRAMREKRQTLVRRQGDNTPPSPSLEDHRRRTLALIDRLADAEDQPPRLQERLTDPASSTASNSAGPSNVGPRLLERLSEPDSSGPSDERPRLLERLSDAPRDEEVPPLRLLERLAVSNPSSEDGKEKLMQRVDVRLEERVSTMARPRRRRTHHRTDKRISRLEVLVRAPSPETEGLVDWPWTDEEIDWFIDREEYRPDEFADDEEENSDAMDEN
ncbi:hypothetical protein R3P38DRAFT_2809731 [Favolaschia claudopus]|uniref:RRM domain-containing protein n=1 Tax=Favolaschia claudopus TaxID=2862362 RepID=A0AAV9ZCV7_9AGAR